VQLLMNSHRKDPVKPDLSVIEHRIAQSVSFHRCLPGYSPTPLVSLTALTGQIGFSGIRIKDEGKRFGLKAFKALGASYAIFRYLKEKCGGMLESGEFLTKGAVVAGDAVFTTATDGNHGRAVAWTARLLNRPAVIYMPAGSAQSRIDAIKSEGAEVIVIDGSYDDAVGRASIDASKYGRVIIADTGYEGYLDVPLFIQQGYLTMFAEIRDQMIATKEFVPDLVFIQSGVGAFAAAASEFFSAFFPDAWLISVEPLTADCLLKSAESADGKPISVPSKSETIMAGLNCGTPSLAAWDIIRDNFYAFVAIEDFWAKEAMRLLSRHDIISGESGCAGMAALLALKAEHPDFFKEFHKKAGRNILLINTEADTDPDSYQRII
jgi:diaminopropionate ammonia-lyase